MSEKLLDKLIKLDILLPSYYEELVDPVDLFLEEYLLLSEITVPSIKNATISYLVWEPLSIIY